LIAGGGWIMSARDELRLQVIGDFREGKITRREAALLCQMSERSVARLTARVRSGGPPGIIHGNRGKRPSNRTPSAVETEMMELMKSRYYDFNLQHAWEMLTEHHGLKVSTDTLRRWCRKHGVGKRKKRRPSKARIARERMSGMGLMVQMDGSSHHWIKREKWCLIGGIDDASSMVVGCRFFASEDTFSTLAVLRSIVETHGIPVSVYVDRGKAFGGIRDEEQNQFARACQELGITVINALSPQAKGRIERLWRTFQDRLVAELRLAGTSSMAQANTYLTERFIPNYWNKRKTHAPRDPENRFRKLDAKTDLSGIFCKKYTRTIRTGQLIDFRGRTYQLKSPVVGSIAGHTVSIQEAPDGSWRVFYGAFEVKLLPWEHRGRPRYFKRVS
jgi:transposase